MLIIHVVRHKVLCADIIMSKSEKKVKQIDLLKTLRRVSTMIICVIITLIACLCFSTDNVSVTVSSKSGEPIYFGNRNSNKIALMFNCYEGADVIYEIAETLEERNFRATFFFGGCFADDHPEIIKKLYESGHEIGNHGFLHKDMGKIGYEANVTEMKNTHDVIKSMTGVDTVLFAPPSGDFSSTTIKACRDLGYVMIMWSKDTVDWLDRTSKSVYNRATKDVRGGDFVLMHPFSHTLEALPKILNKYISEGMVVTTVSDCLSE